MKNKINKKRIKGRPFIKPTSVKRSEDLELLAEVLLLALTLCSLSADLLVVFLEGSKILTGLGELTLLHALSDVPVDEGSLGVHEIELVVDSGQGLSDGSGVGNHAHSALDTSQVTAGNDCGGLVVDAALEAGGAPVDELNGPLGLDGGNSRVDILGDDVSSEHHAAGHVLAVAGVALGEHVGGLEDGVSDLRNRELLVVSLLSRDDGGVRGKHKVDSGVRHQVGLELRDIDVEGTIESEGGSEGGDDLADKSVQVGVGGSLNVEVSAAHIVQGLVIKAEGAVSVLQEGVGRQDVVVGLNDGGGNLGSRGDSEGQLGLAAIVDGESLQKEGAEAGASSTTSGVEDHEALETSAVVSQLADSVKDKVDHLLANGVVTTGVVVGSILLAGHELLRVVELSVGAGADLVADRGLQVDEDATRDVLSSASLREEGVEGVVATADSLVGGHLAVGLDAVLEAEKLPAGVTSLDAGLAEVKC